MTEEIKGKGLDSPLKKAFYQLKKAQAELEVYRKKEKSDIAVIGIAVNLPGAPNIGEYWKLLKEGRSAIGELPDNRKKLYYGSDDKTISGNAGFLDSISNFDYEVFNITPLEAEKMNPAHRLFLQNSWHVLEDGGYANMEAKNIGVYLGYSGELAFTEYTNLINIKGKGADAAVVTGNASAIAPGRIAHQLNLTGPAMIVDTACSSSLTAVHLACEAIKNADCELAVAGGVNVDIIPQEEKYKVGFESENGTIRPFDKGAAGTMTGEGVASVLLKKLDKAIEDGDHIYGVIKSTEVNHDGQSSSITAPSLSAQKRLLTEAWKKSKIEVNRLKYIEAHGTGTKLGDPIEITAINQALQELNHPGGCIVGTVKSNIGHLFASAGIASLIKCVLIAQKRIIPPLVNLNDPIDEITKEGSKVTVNVNGIEFEEGDFCGVSSFGFSGTNAHVVLGGYEQALSNDSEVLGNCLFTLSAKNKEALVKQAENYALYLQNNPDVNLFDLCYSVNNGRMHLKTRLAVFAVSLEDVEKGLASFIGNENSENLFSSPDHVTVTDRLDWQEKVDAIMRNSASLNHEEWRELANAYVRGAKMDWVQLPSNIGNRIATPHYAFDEIECWPKPEKKKSETSNQNVTEELMALVSEMTGIATEELVLEEEFFAYGVDSLVLLQVIEKVRADFKLDIKINDFYDKILNLRDLIDYINESGTVEEEVEPEVIQNESELITNSDAMTAVLERLDRIEAKLGHSGISTLPSIKTEQTKNKAGQVFYGKSLLKERTPISKEQQAYINALTLSYNSKTSKSKTFAADNRGQLADWINSIDYRHSLKELLYPIVAKSGQGAYMQDIDENSYIDIGLGYGVSFFGNNPEFVKKAVGEQLENGFELALQSARVKSIAEKFCQLTGVERICFSNTGTEAVMAAVRLARAKTGRNKIVIFSGSYHGTFDGILGMSTSGDGLAIPISAGTPESFVDDLVVLNFGSDQALEYIAEHSGKIAGVLTEPVQSRKPGIQNGDFLKALRNVTAENQIVLILDEIITGFRIGAGGAQAYFDVKADLVTYGKVIGGGMPIGIIGGTKACLDLIDGGEWNYGDESYPEIDRMLYGGTFCKHPIALAAVEAVLDKINAEKNEIYPKINRLANNLAEQLNAYFGTEELPVELVNFGGLFRFEFSGKYQAINNPIEIPLFFYGLIHEGVYTWERRICFLSTEHTQEDIDSIVQKVKTVFDKMRAAGFFSDETSIGNKKLTPEKIPLNHAQKRMWILDQMAERQAAYNLGYAYKLSGDFKLEVFKKAYVHLVKENELMRANVLSENLDPYLKISVDSERGFEFMDVTGYSVSHIERELQQAIWKPFNLETDSLIRLKLLKADNEYYMALCAHHIVADGWSMNVIMKELGTYYKAFGENVNPVSSSKLKWAEIEERESKYIAEEGQEAKAFWLDRLSGEIPKLDFPVFKTRPTEQTFVGETVNYVLPENSAKYITYLARTQKVSLFNVLQSLVKVLLYKYTGQKDIILGTSVHGRSGETFESIGNFINNIPLRSKIDSDLSFNEFLELEKKQLFDCFKHQNYPFDQLVEDLNLDRDLSRSPLFDVIVQLESGDLAAYHDIEAFFNGVDFTPISVADESSEKDLFIEFVQKKEQIEARVNFNTDVLERHQIDQLVRHLNKLIEAIQKTEGTAKIKTFNLLLSEEIKSLDKWNETEVPLAKNEHFVSYFERQVCLNPNAIAVSCEGEHYTYENLNAKANQLAHFLVAQKTADLIGVLMDRSPEMTISILGIWKAGKAYIPIDTSYPLDRIASILQESESELVITNKPESDLKEGFESRFENCRLIDYEQIKEDLKSEKTSNPNIQIAPTDLAYAIFTSGSTGKPKGAMIEHIGMINHMSCKVHDLNLGHLPEPGWSAESNCKKANDWQANLWRSARKKDLKKCFVHYKKFEIQAAELSEKHFAKAYQELLHKHGYLKTLFQLREGKLWSYMGSDPQMIFKQEQMDDAYWLERMERQVRYFELGVEMVGESKFNLHYYLSDMLAGHTQVDKVNADFISLLLGTKTESILLENEELIENADVDQEDLIPVIENLRTYRKMEFNLGHLNQPQVNAIASQQALVVDKASLNKALKITGKSTEEFCLLSLSMLLSRYIDGNIVTLDIRHFFQTEQNKNRVTRTNDLPLVVNWSEEKTVGEQLDDACESLANLKKIKGVGVQQLLTELDKHQSGSETNIERNIAFEFHTAELNLINKTNHFFSIYDLIFRFVETGTALNLVLDYNISAVSDDMAKRILKHLQTVMLRFVENLEQNISNFDFIDEVEKEELLKIGKPETKDIAFVSMIDRFEAIAESHPNNIAVVFNQTPFDYKTIHTMSNQVAGVLKEKSEGKMNCRVGVLMPRNEMMVVLIMAIQKAGFIYVPLDLNFPEERLKYIGTDAELDFVVCTEESIESINLSALFLSEIEKQMGKFSEDNVQRNVTEVETFSILYTSGTTGKPKGVEIGQGGLSALLDWGVEEFKSESIDNVLAGTPICFDVSMFELFFPLTQGKTVLLLEENYTQENLEVYLSNYTNIAIHTSPTNLSGFMTENLDFTNLSVINLAGEPVPVSFRKLLKGRNISVRNIYGPTETTVYSSCYRFDDRYMDIIPMGRPIAGESIFILDANLELCPIGMIGQVCIGGKGVSKGYLNRPELNESCFVSPKALSGERVYLTGDFGRILPDGEIEFLGRKDNQVNVRGYRIELGEIEQATNRMNGVLAAAAGTIFDPQGEEHIILHYVCEDNVRPEQVRDYLLSVLTFYMVPSFILAVDQFEKTINGKIDRSKLPAPFGGKSSAKKVWNALPFDRRNRIASFYEAENLVPIIAQNASHCFDISVWQMFVAHLVGGKTVIYKNEFVKDVLAFANQTSADEISVLELVPSYLSVTLDIFSDRSIESSFWRKLDYLMVTGETLKRNLTNRWFTQFGNRIPIVNAYGPTEASDDITHHFMLRKEDESRSVPIGRTIQNMKNYVLDEALNQVPIGCKGLIYTDGVGVGKGYVNNPEKTNQVFVPSPFSQGIMYNTGDIGRYLPDGTLEYFGRVDHQIKIRGNRIELGEIEHTLSNVINGNEAMVLLKTEEGTEPQIVAYIRNKAGKSLDEIRTGLFKKLPAYMVPDIFVELETIPLSDNGKIDRKALARMKVETVSEVDTSNEEELTETEVNVRRGWEMVLGHNNFSSTSNFFEVGGNSLKLMKLFRTLDDCFPDTIKVTDLFKQVTIKSQAHLFENENKAEESEELIELNF